MKTMLATTSLIVMTSTFMSSYADGGRLYHVESITDKLYSNPLTMPEKLGISHERNAQSCRTKNTAVITIYSTNGEAQTEIDVKVDGSLVGTLTTYFPANGPRCETPSAKGIVTLVVPAGKHTLVADSPNVTWPSHSFSVNQCQCMVLPLS
jgi:hypothetical protein